MIYRDLCQYEFDTTDLYNSYRGNKWLYQDVSEHTSVTGNRLLADYLLHKIIAPINEISCGEKDDTIVYEGEPQFTIATIDDIHKYIERVKNSRQVEAENIGAIVMNCNPFTYGHRYLVEYASKQVEFLYLFVVEEDLSAVPFPDRFLMVYEGIKDIANVAVVPSGHFIISQDTFKNYFEKETDVRDVSTEEDAYIFARYIAKGLNITKRFVGEEPMDNVTNIYNRTMEKIFGKYNIELIEIPRKELDSGEIISATRVRKLLLNDEWTEIAKYVPTSTFEYLGRISKTVKQRMKEKKEQMKELEEQITKQTLRDTYIQSKIKEFADRVCGLEKAVIYTVGRDTKGLIKYLPEEVVEQLEYCDKMARTEEVVFNGKIVESPEQLLKKYKDYKIIVTSTLYGAKIYEEFIEMGIEPERCIFNSISFYMDSE